jgi:hypothetical protein
MLVLFRSDANEILGSHPFVIGYRQGKYYDLWGGSAVADPILELELGDVDGDGQDELVVLEAGEGEDSRTVAVWRWHGWGFSLIWRSEPGHYLDLQLLDDGQDNLVLVKIS